MNNKGVKLLISFFIALISTVIVFILPINNIYSFTVLYIEFSIYMIFNYYNNIRISYMSYLYLLWILITILLNIFFFSLINIIITLIIAIILVYQYYIELNKKKKLMIKLEKERKKEKEKKKKSTTQKKTIVKVPNFLEEDDFENISKKLYLNMQDSFTNLNYDKLKSILDKKLYEQYEQQMNHLEKNNKRSVRENIKIFDYKINNYNTVNNELVVSISIGVYEDKYTMYLDNKSNIKKLTYESFYEIEYKKDKNWKISNLKLIYSHSKKN